MNFLKRLQRKYSYLVTNIFYAGKNMQSTPERKAEILFSLNKGGILVETGTYHGVTASLLHNKFDDIYSIEIDEILYKKAKERFANIPNVHLYHGDSGTVLRQYFADDTNVLYFLDAHDTPPYTLDNTPIASELNVVLDELFNTVVIDDARHFTLSATRKIKSLARDHGYTFRIQEGMFVLCYT